MLNNNFIVVVSSTENSVDDARGKESHVMISEYQARYASSVLVIMGDPPSQSVRYLTPLVAKK